MSLMFGETICNDVLHQDRVSLPKKMRDIQKLTERVRDLVEVIELLKVKETDLKDANHNDFLPPEQKAMLETIRRNLLDKKYRPTKQDRDLLQELEQAAKYYKDVEIFRNQEKLQERIQELREIKILLKKTSMGKKFFARTISNLKEKLW